jgi:hypothetical protein
MGSSSLNAEVNAFERLQIVRRRNRAWSRRLYVPPAQLALAAAAATRRDEAIHHARDAFEIRDPECQFFFSRHLPYSAPLYAYPRFCEMLAGMGRSEWLRD